MKSSLRSFTLFALALGCAAFASTPARAADETVYELRTYYTLPGKLDNLLARFRDHTCKLFEKHGMVNVGYWVPTDDKDGKGSKLIYLLQHKSREAAAASWKAFGADADWQAARKASEAGGRIVEKVESVFLAATDFSPALSEVPKGTGRTYELRTYTTAEGKLAALNARFRNHTRALFEKHGMTNGLYFHPLDADKGAGKTLIYFMAYPNRDTATKAWAAFRADPVWVAAKSASEKDGTLTVQNGVVSVFLAPTDFSALK
jgi:hypothetical protein